MGNIELSLVIPGYNEDSIIVENLKKVHSVVSKLGITFEIIFVNDGSTDKTGDVTQILSKSLKNLKIISYPGNRGRGHALRQGLMEAQGKYILTTESDLNYGENVICELYNSIVSSKYDIVVASPYMKGGKTANVPTKRLILSKWGNKILAASLGSIVHTISGMTRIYKRDCIQTIFLTSNDKEIHLEILSKALALGYQITEIPATLAWPDRKFRKTVKRKSTFSTLKYINSHMIFTLFERPILFFGLVGLFIFLTGIGFGGYIVYLWLTGGLNPTRPLMTLTVLMVIGGVIVFSFGLLGMQINDLRREIYRIQTKLKND